MRHYELMAVLDVDLDSEAAETSGKKIESLIANNNGKIDKIEPMGKRRLAYEINHKKEGTYTVYYFQGESETIKELDRVLGITDEIIRFGIFRLPEKN